MSNRKSTIALTVFTRSRNQIKNFTRLAQNIPRNPTPESSKICNYSSWSKSPKHPFPTFHRPISLTFWFVGLFWPALNRHRVKWNSHFSSFCLLFLLRCWTCSPWSHKINVSHDVSYASPFNYFVNFWFFKNKISKSFSKLIFNPKVNKLNMVPRLTRCTIWLIKCKLMEIWYA